MEHHQRKGILLYLNSNNSLYRNSLRTESLTYAIIFTMFSIMLHWLMVGNGEWMDGWMAEQRREVEREQYFMAIIYTSSHSNVPVQWGFFLNYSS